MTLDTVTIPEQAATRLSSEEVIWLTTVRKSGAPAPTPVWYLWSGGEFLIFSRPDAAKMAHIERNSQVTLSFNSDTHGGAISVFTGPARVDDDGPSSSEWDEYVTKYRSGLEGLKLTPAQMRDEYSALLRVRPEEWRGW